MKQAGPCLFCSARCLFNLFTQANGVPAFEDSLCLLILFLSFFLYLHGAQRKTHPTAYAFMCVEWLLPLFSQVL